MAKQVYIERDKDEKFLESQKRQRPKNENPQNNGTTPVIALKTVGKV